MFAQKGDYDAEARLDRGPASSGADGGVFPPDSPLTNGMSASSADIEPDSSVGGGDDGLTFRIPSDEDTGNPPPGRRGVSECLPRTALRGVSDFSVAECGASDLAAIRNVVRSVAGARTLWLPAVIATAGRRVEDGGSLQPAEGVFTGTTRRFAERVSTAKHPPPKVQILSSVTIPRQGTVSPLPRRVPDGSRGPFRSEYLNRNIAYETDHSVTSPPESAVMIPTGNGGTPGMTAVRNSSDAETAHVFRPEMSFRSTGAGQKTLDCNRTDWYDVVSNAIRARRVQPIGPIKTTHRQTTSIGPTGGSEVSTIRTGAGGRPTGKVRVPVPIRVSESDGASTQKRDSPCGKVIPDTIVPSKALPQQNSPRIIVSASAHQNNRIHSQYYRSPDADLAGKSIRGVIPVDGLQISTASNRNLTAQILQSLSRPEATFSSQSGTFTSQPNRTDSDSRRGYEFHRRRRHVYGDPSSALGVDDTVGTEERPAASDDALPYHYRTLQTVMLDHTYAVAASSGTTDPDRVPEGAPAVQPPPPVGGIPSASPARVRHSPPPPDDARRVLDRFEVQRREDDAGSVVSSVEGERPERTDGRHDSDTETAPEGEEEGKTRCVCDYAHDDGYMICCDRCGEWQHVDCMGIDRQNIPDDYMCDRCQPRPVDRKRARAIQTRKREELPGFCSSASDSSAGASPVRRRRHRPLDAASPSALPRRRPLTVTTYSNTIGGVSRAVPGVRLTPAPPVVPLPVGKRGPKRPRRSDPGRKGPKRKPAEKRAKRKGNDHSSIPRDRLSVPAPPGPPGRRSDGYESAATNHYSPELRARVARYCAKVGAPASGSASALAARHCTTVPHAGGKILIATRDLRENTPVVELRGKYMLSARHRPRPQPSGRAGGQRPGPFLFFYRLPRDSAQVCIDTRTYGNEARFVRRSCKPNAELQHCIVKGALHVYLATIAPIRSNTEISIRHESAAGGRQACACGNPERCERGPITGPTSRGLARRETSRGAFRERRGRARRSPLSTLHIPRLIEPEIDDKQCVETEGRQLFLGEIAPVVMSPVKEEKFELTAPPSPEKKPIMKAELVETPLKEEPLQEPKEDIQITNHKIPIFIKEEAKVEKDPSPEKEEVFQPALSPQIKLEPEMPLADIEAPIVPEISDVTSFPVDTPVSPKEECSDTLVTGRRLSGLSCRATRASLSAASRTTTDPPSADEKSDGQGDTVPPTLSAKDKKKMTREERKLEAIMKAIERMEKAEQRKLENRDRQTKRRESVSTCAPTNADSLSPGEAREEGGGDHTDDISQLSPVRRRRRRKGRTVSDSRSGTRPDSADSDMVTSGDESLPLPLLSPPPTTHALLSPPQSSRALLSPPSSIPPPVTSPYREMSLSESQLALEQTVQRIGVGLSSACLLVEAAVAPFDNAFKFPKTKKTIISEWFGETRSLRDDTRPFADRHPPPPARSIENLVRVANDMIVSLDEGVDSTSPPSPPISPLRGLRRPARDIVSTADARSRTPKKCRRGFKTGPDDRPNPHKRSLRSGVAPGRSDEEFTLPEPETAVEAMPDREENTEPNTPAPRPPQHSAKKRWLRQAISEESDSPTAGAESPPNEMVTPLKKRRLARESLSLEPPALGQLQSEDLRSTETPTKDVFSGNFVPSEAFVSPCLIFDNPAAACDPPPDEASNEDLRLSYQSEDKEHLKPACNSREDPSSDVSVFCREGEDTECLEPPHPKGIICQNDNIKMEIKEPETDPESTILHIETPREISPSERNGVPSTDGCDAPSAETSGGSSPSLDEMDDIQKKIHSFHTENIQILKIRNKKPPKEKRKKVNLNFDLCVLDDQTVGVKLKDEAEEEEIAPTPPPLDEVIPPPVSPREMPSENGSERPLPSPRTPPRPDPPLPRFPSAGLFSSDGFQRDLSETLVDVDAIKNAIDLTTNLETGATDEYVNVREILSRVNRMDSSSSLVLSEVLRDAGHSHTDITTPALTLPRPMPSTKTFQARSNDPRLNPPPVADRPKPVRRKLSITEYRKRHNINTGETDGGDGGEEGRGSPVLSLSTNAPVSHTCSGADDVKEGLLYYNNSEEPPSPRKDRERDKLSERLRREFGLTLAEEESAPLTGLPLNVINGTGEAVRSTTSLQRESDEGSPLPSPSCTPSPSLSPSPTAEMRPLRLDR